MTPLLRFVGLTTILLIMFSFSTLSKAGTIRTEDFDDDPNWLLVGNGTNGNDFGFRRSAVAGGAVGEAGGRFTRSSFVRTYADADLISPLNLNTPFTASGKFNFIVDNHPDFGRGLQIGHFHVLGQAAVGMSFNNNGTGNLHWNALLRFDDGSEVRGPSIRLVSSQTRNWNYEWDPFGGSSGGGLLSVTLGFSNGDVTQTLDLDSELRDQGFLIDAFGFNSEAMGEGNTNNIADMFIDDLTYTVASAFSPGCDFDHNAVCHMTDINQMLQVGDLVMGVPTSVTTDKFDLIDNEVIDAVDITEWLSLAAVKNGYDTPFSRGDINLDHDVDTRDLTAMIIGFTSAGGTGSTWNTGDTDGDGDTDTVDLTKAIMNFTSARNAAAAVPEPSGLLLLVLAVGCLAVARARSCRNV